MTSLLAFLVQGIPELMGVTALSLAFAKIPLKWIRILIIATILALLAFWIRNIQVTYGMHLIIVLLMFILTLPKLINIPASKVFIAVFLSTFILAILELLIHNIIFMVTDIDYVEIMESNNLLWALFGLPQAVILIIMAFLVARCRKPHIYNWRF